ncbi:hypothetical protein FD03_GL002247 [Companilactobacillus nodensis DSM 19682 = JCM 14932 = NBRC 107160]|uniref:Uncharacterized protein n=2 Tax=Companilactobacillus nodensis TaxID=460870 RepID=A0A0R1K5F4_9LACO|nr:hypothetical protein [Companilactobacillus nodensis]KRK78475.1 hypothetical protein FD03_GL002247 [Companilactobacillus nodensis DSM 19682 = JCM 14932 = NBRC 107160]
MIYIKTNDLGAVTDYLKTDDGVVKQFDDFKPDQLLIDQGYIYVHLIETEYPLFEQLHSYYTYFDGQLHRPYNFDRRIIENILDGD